MFVQGLCVDFSQKLFVVSQAKSIVTTFEPEVLFAFHYLSRFFLSAGGHCALSSSPCMLFQYEPHLIFLDNVFLM